MEASEVTGIPRHKGYLLSLTRLQLSPAEGDLSFSCVSKETGKDVSQRDDKAPGANSRMRSSASRQLRCHSKHGSSADSSPFSSTFPSTSTSSPGESDTETEEWDLSPPLSPSSYGCALPCHVEGTPRTPPSVEEGGSEDSGSLSSRELSAGHAEDDKALEGGISSTATFHLESQTPLGTHCDFPVLQIRNTEESGIWSPGTLLTSSSLDESGDDSPGALAPPSEETVAAGAAWPLHDRCVAQTLPTAPKPELPRTAAAPLLQTLQECSLSYARLATQKNLLEEQALEGLRVGLPRGGAELMEHDEEDDHMVLLACCKRLLEGSKSSGDELRKKLECLKAAQRRLAGAAQTWRQQSDAVERAAAAATVMLAAKGVRHPEESSVDATLFSGRHASVELAMEG